MKVKLKINKPTAIFKDVDAKMTAFLKAEIEATINDISDDAKAKVPVDTAFLKDSITPTSNDLIGEVKVGMHYAPYVEFGTGGLVDVPAGISVFALKFKGNGIKQVNLAPRPFLFPAYFANIEKLKERIKTKIDSK
jgi:HK97 gp10 family phage protein